MVQWWAVVEIVLLTAVFLYLAVFWWSLQRRREREAFYRHETARRLLEREGAGVERALSWLRQEDEAAARRQRHGRLTTALICIAAGLGSFLALGTVRGEDSAFGWIPTLIGVALLVSLAIGRGGRDGGSGG